jgi:hypothetical protein
LSRFFAFAVCFSCTTAVAAGAVVACGSSDNLEGNVTSSDAGTNIKRDSAPVEPVESGSPLDAALAPQPRCDKYCELVTANCTGANAQYASVEECAKFCEKLPLTAKTRTGAGPDEKDAPSVACRQYWADSPSKTSPGEFCLAAGPFGGNTCGDRCTAFCDVVLSACSPDAGNAPYADRGDCASACASFAYRDAGTDGGGEGPTGPNTGDSLNCRLWQLRAAVMHPEKCPYLQPQSTACHD